MDEKKTGNVVSLEGALEKKAESLQTDYNKATRVLGNLCARYGILIGDTYTTTYESAYEELIHIPNKFLRGNIAKKKVQLANKISELELKMLKAYENLERFK